MGKPIKNNLFAYTMSYRIPILKIISGITNIIIEILLNVISMPRNMFFVTRHYGLPFSPKV